MMFDFGVNVIFNSNLHRFYLLCIFVLNFQELMPLRDHSNRSYHQHLDFYRMNHQLDVMHFPVFVFVLENCWGKIKKKKKRKNDATKIVFFVSWKKLSKFGLNLLKLNIQFHDGMNILLFFFHFFVQECKTKKLPNLKKIYGLKIKNKTKKSALFVWIQEFQIDLEMQDYQFHTFTQTSPTISVLIFQPTPSFATKFPKIHPCLLCCTQTSPPGWNLVVAIVFFSGFVKRCVFQK